MKIAESISGKELEVVPRLLGPVVTPTEICPRCELRGRHAGWLECIDALRDVLGRLQLREEELREKLGLQHTRAKRQPSKNCRWVVLDGVRMPISTAARALGISSSTLHLRLLNRTHNPEYQDVDVRQVGADVAKRGACGAARQEPPTESQREVADGRLS